MPADNYIKKLIRICLDFARLAMFSPDSLHYQGRKTGGVKVSLLENAKCLLLPTPAPPAKEEGESLKNLYLVVILKKAYLYSIQASERIEAKLSDLHDLINAKFPFL